mmetsp:Transcript_10110/g.24435  ORF Transcript_10110/g.24435 Transcript_10110/m.24435 type:complete len:216 (-) Transcript_10110:79-726(-)
MCHPLWQSLKFQLLLSSRFFGLSFCVDAEKAAGMGLQKVVAGGQTGVDQAALTAARELGLATGGFCPEDGSDENGPIPDLAEWHLTPLTPDVWKAHEGLFEDLGLCSDPDKFARRTLMNALESSGTLTILPKDVLDGTNLGMEAVKALGKPQLVFTFADAADIPAARKKFLAWLQQNNIQVLNINGPRESSVPGIYAKSKALFLGIFVGARTVTP